MTGHVLALDQGTTSCRAMLFDAGGRAVSKVQREFPQYFPQSGWVEHDAREIWQTQLAVAREALSEAGLSAVDIAAIGIANQRETTVIWDRQTGEPIHRAVVWQDRRSASLCQRLEEEGYGAQVSARTGLRLDAYFSAGKIVWLLAHVPGARARAERGELAFGTIDSWLVWQLTGGLHITDVSNVSRTLLYNIHSGQWDDDLLALFDIPRALLPEIRSSSDIYGHTQEALFGGRIAIGGIAGDQQAASFGQACFTPGMAKNTYGTGCFLLMNTGERAIPSANHLLTTLGWEVNGARSYALEGSVFVAGAAVQWLRDGLGIIGSSGEVEALAASVPDNGGVTFVPAFVGQGAPHWDARARGMMIGLTRGSSRGHIARAALEAIAFQSAELIEAMQRDSGVAITELRVDGGASVNNLLMQFQADLLGVPVLRPAITETTALGAGYLAGLAAGLWSMDDLRGHWRAERVFTPAMGDDERQVRLGRWQKAVRRSASWEEA